MITGDKNITGYPGIDKPWLKYYSEDAVSADIPNQTLYEMVFENHSNHLSDIALNYFGKRITYGSLFETIDKMASALVNSGVERGDYISIMSLSTPETICLFYAINKIGAVACLEYIALNTTSLTKTIRTVKPKMLFILDLFCDKIDNNSVEDIEVIKLPFARSMPLQAKLLAITKYRTKKLSSAISFTNFMNRGHGEPPVLKNNASDICVLMNTSGTTGVPKKVALSNFNINSIAVQYEYTGMGFRRKEKFIGVAPIFHAFGLIIGIHLPLVEGLENILCIDDKMVFRLMEVQRVNHIVCINALIPLIYKCDFDLSYLKTLSIGGESMSPKEVDKANKFLKDHGSFAKLVAGYGMTELSGTAITELIHATRLGSVGIPLPKVNVRILDSNTNKDLGYNQSGEIVVNSPGVMQRYLCNEAETKKSLFIDNENSIWIHTGDIGKIDEDGFVYILGRMKRIAMYKTQDDGIVLKIFPDYIEHIICSYEEVKESAVILVKDHVHLNIPIAYVVLNHREQTTDYTIIETKIKTYILSATSEYNVPKKFYFVDRIPILPNGKRDYNLLENQAKKLNIEG